MIVTVPALPSTVTAGRWRSGRWRRGRRPPRGCRTRGRRPRRGKWRRPSPSPGRRRSGTAASSPGRWTARPGSRRAPGGRRRGSRITRAAAGDRAGRGRACRAARRRAGVGAGQRLRLGAVGEQHPRDVPAAQLARRSRRAARRTSARRSAPASAGARFAAGQEEDVVRPRRAGPASASSSPTGAQLRRRGAPAPHEVELGQLAQAGQLPRAGRRAKPTSARPQRPRRPAPRPTSRSHRGRPAARAPRRTARPGPASGSSSAQVVGQHAEDVRRVLRPARQPEVDLGDARGGRTRRRNAGQPALQRRRAACPRGSAAASSAASTGASAAAASASARMRSASAQSSRSISVVDVVRQRRAAPSCELARAGAPPSSCAGQRRAWRTRRPAAGRCRAPPGRRRSSSARRRGRAARRAWRPARHAAALARARAPSRPTRRGAAAGLTSACTHAERQPVQPDRRARRRPQATGGAEACDHARRGSSSRLAQHRGGARLHHAEHPRQRCPPGRRLRTAAVTSRKSRCPATASTAGPSSGRRGGRPATRGEPTPSRSAGTRRGPSA